MTDTIVALSSGTLPSGVAIIRVSGPATRDLLERIAGGTPPPRQLALRRVGEDLDRGLVAWFPKPNSFTGEDCAELQVHGSTAVVRALLRTLTEAAGVRLAAAGEFTRRAFENGKLDLTEVEGLGDLISAETENQRRQALARMRGGVSDRIERWRSALLDARAEIEARLDFSDEGDVGALPAGFGLKLEMLRDELNDAERAVERGRIIREGFRVALAGPPNAGKSSLLNAFARSEVAIVTDEPGTTRDVRELSLDVNGVLIVLVDMAGLRDSDSKAEAEGVRRARSEVAAADLVLWLVAPDLPTAPCPDVDVPIWTVFTKSDLVMRSGADSVSARTGAGVEDLLERIGAAAQGDPSIDPPLLSRERDRAALVAAQTAVLAAIRNLGHPELAADDLRHASSALERLLGHVDAEADSTDSSSASASANDSRETPCFRPTVDSRETLV